VDANKGASVVAHTVITFRIERYDSDGNRLPPVPVEIRGEHIEGVIVEGDSVSVSGRSTLGSVMHVKTVENHSMGMTVCAQATALGTFSRTWNKGMFFVVVAIVLVMIALASRGCAS
jgi:hypothetical protein